MTLVEETLRVWREAERVLEGLPDTDPDYTEVAVAVVRVKDVYRDVTEQRWELTAEKLATSFLIIDRAEALLARVHAKLVGRPDGRS